LKCQGPRLVLLKWRTRERRTENGPRVSLVTPLVCLQVAGANTVLNTVTTCVNTLAFLRVSTALYLGGWCMLRLCVRLCMRMHCGM
jgi:hypothetical protein